jgi:hypothetical protein
MTAPSTGITSSAPSSREDPADGRPARRLAWLGIGGALTSIVLVGGLHGWPETARVDPIRRTISEYALSSVGWAFNVGVVALAVGSLAVAAGLVIAGLARAGSLGIALIGVWSAALLVIMFYPKHNWAVGPSVNGQIHRVASIVAFLVLPLAVLLLTRRPRPFAGAERQPRPVPARVARWLGVLSLAWFAPIFGSLLLSPVTGTPWWRAIPLGLGERGLVISEVLAVIALGIWVLHASGRRTTRLSARKQPRNPRPATPAQTGQAA